MPKLSKPTLADRLKSSGVKLYRDSEPVWKGPEEEGVTQSLLGRFLCCRERFRLLVVKGFKPEDAFNVRLEYGNLWHACEEAHAAGLPITDKLLAYCKQLAKQYPLQAEQVEHWYNVCKLQFPIYVEWWEKHPDTLQRTPISQEQVFSVPYVLPYTGRIVRLRGKFDAVDLIGRGRLAGEYLQENKTKGDIVARTMQRQLTFDLQTMLYLIALKSMRSNPSKVKGVRYNVVRRPLSGGKHSIKQLEGTQGARCNLKSCKKEPDPSCEKCRGSGRYGARPPEKLHEYYSRLADLIKNDSVDPVTKDHHYFMRWKVEISDRDIEKFKQECLDPVLEQLCDWWTCINGGTITHDVSRYQHYRLPYGIYNPTTEGIRSEVDEYLESGSELGLRRVDNLFPELT